MKTRRLAIALVAPLALASGLAAAQEWPTKPVRAIIAFTPGSATDIAGRIVAERLGAVLGQPVIAENRVGAGGTIGANAVAKADPDGYTFLFNSSAQASNPAIFAQLPFDTFKDFIHVTAIAGQPNVVVVNPDRGYKTLKDVVAAAKAKPGQLNYAHAGIGSGTHLNSEKFRLAAGIDIVAIPHKGTPEALNDVLAGRVEYYFCPITAALAQVKGGKVHALAVSSPKRSAMLPDVPTTVEAGFPKSEYMLWVGMWLPAKTPPAIVQKLHAATVKALGEPEVKERLAKLGADPMPMSMPEFEAFMRSEVDDAMRIAKAAGIKPQ
ncbi:MAG TPA: tripartite tricarboxylate transporter substrate binding protein [Burkholderiales bacterium]|jgi:tripartite-type tricarboxylate transporter receptor subunit TctC|nr:tripartite tricarboxylate transporter substrate binding protein [Burkholderiales bacterium]